MEFCGFLKKLLGIFWVLSKSFATPSWLKAYQKCPDYFIHTSELLRISAYAISLVISGYIGQLYVIFYSICQGSTLLTILGMASPPPAEVHHPGSPPASLRP